MLKAELDNHLGYDPYERTENSNSINGSKSKKLRSKYGEIEVNVPQDRESSFEPKIVKKRQKDISKIGDKIITMYAKGLSTHQISEQIEEFPSDTALLKALYLSTFEATKKWTMPL